MTVVSCRKNWSDWHDIERIAIVEQCFRFCLPFVWGHTVVYFGSKYASNTYKLSKSSIDLSNKSRTFCEAYIMFGKISKHSDSYVINTYVDIFTRTLHRSHLNKGCYCMLHTPLKCNHVNFDIPNEFLYYGNPFGISKLTRLHFKGVCNIP